VYTEKIRDNPFRNLWGGVPCSLEQKGLKPLSLTSTTWISSSYQQMAYGLEIILKYHLVFHKADSTHETDSACESLGFECSVLGMFVSEGILVFTHTRTMVGLPVYVCDKLI